MTDEDLESLKRSLRPQLKTIADAHVQMAKTLDQMAGAMAVREQQGESQRQLMLDTANAMRLDVAALAGRLDGFMLRDEREDHHDRPTPKADKAADELEAEAKGLLAGILRTLRRGPARLFGLAGEGWTWARANPIKAVASLVGVAAVVRELAGIIPELAPAAAVLEALVRVYTPGAVTATGTGAMPGPTPGTGAVP